MNWITENRQDDLTSKLLVVDDDSDLRNTLQRFLIMTGFEVQAAADGEQASKILAVSPVDLVITDIVMAEKDGFGLIHEIRSKYPGIRVIAISGGGAHASSSYLSMARRLGADATFPKPLAFQDLLKCIQELLVKAAP